MKISAVYFLAAILLLSSTISSQSFDTVYVHSDSLKENTIRLDSVWRYHSGDDSSWTSPSYDDSSWDTLKTWFYLDEISDSIWSGIGWFRKTIVIDSLLINKSISFQIYHFGASQIFWNGERIHEYGTVGVDTASEKSDQPNDIPIVINLDTNLVNTLAIRYSNQSSITEKDWMIKWFRRGGFRSRIGNVNTTYSELFYFGRVSAAINFGISGLFISLAILYFFLFIFYARRFENLYYSLFSLFVGLLFMSIYFRQFFFISRTTEIIYSSISALSIIYVFLFLLAFLNRIFYHRLGKIFWFFLSFAAIYSALFFFYIPRDIMRYFIPIFVALATLEGLRILIVSIKKKEPNAWVIGVGIISFALLILSLFLVAILSGQLQLNGLVGFAVLMIGIFSIPLSMSVYLAKEIAFTNKNLEQQLKTVKELSVKELEHIKKNAELELTAERNRIENERKFKELEEARNLQLSLLPKNVPDLPEYEIAVYMDTATEVGGDYYDFHVHDNILTVAIGDATGHGLKAGTMVTATKSLFNNFASNPDILDSMKKMSLSLKKMNFRLLSMCFTILKIEDSKVKISSAGMPPIYIYRKGSEEVEEILLKGMPLGSVRIYPYELIETELKSGDLLFLYSDGYPELFNSKKELLGYNKIKAEFKKVGKESPSSVISTFKKLINSWKEELEINDDITFVVIKKK